MGEGLERRVVMKGARKQPIDDQPLAYTEGFLQQDYERVIASIQADQTQAVRSFSPLRTTLLVTLQAPAVGLVGSGGSLPSVM